VFAIKLEEIERGGGFGATTTPSGRIGMDPKKEIRKMYQLLRWLHALDPDKMMN
jgi:hypothetical protein